MRVMFEAILGGVLAAVVADAACAQAVKPPAAPASAAEPMTAASRQMPTRNAAITAAENAKEPGNQRPEERVIPQISVPLKPGKAALAATGASAPAGGAPGGINEGAARCLASSSASEKAACEHSLAASGPPKSTR